MPKSRNTYYINVSSKKLSHQTINYKYSNTNLVKNRKSVNVLGEKCSQNQQFFLFKNMTCLESETKIRTERYYFLNWLLTV